MKDVLVLGSGPAGFYTAVLCASNGLDVTLVEKEDLGGTGFRFGALPVKILLDGIKQNPLISYKQLLEDYHVKMADVQNKLESDLKEAGVSLVFGEGLFMQKDTVKVKDKIIKAKNIVIATGSRPANISKTAYKTNILTHKEALFMDRLPNDIIILGGNVEGIEFATFFARFGVKVTVIEMLEEVLPGNDIDLKQAVIDMLNSLNVGFFTGNKVVELDETTYGAVITLQTGKKLTAEKCLVCLSRLPNIPKGAGDIGIKYGKEGIAVDQNFLTSVPNVYAVGDVNGSCLMGSAAINQGISTALHILGREASFRNTSYEGIPRAMFVIPEIAGVGLQEWELQQKGIKYKAIKHQFARTWRGISKGYKDGFIKVLVDDKNKLQGIWMVGKDASELVGPLGILLKQKLGADNILNGLFVHPSLSEALLDALLKLK
ncbi:MAG: NAD(P)/FAD-dependent oxidoreductase [Thermoanaerobacteraceae bacterium]|nr:NAD(P)/FAD-dependent oxidoreductase [Thermoanaerobacteraceae bacterium]